MNPQIIKYAIEAHEKVNHKYNGAPYSLHLSMVVAYAYKYNDLIPRRALQDVIDACWLHDTIEDCRLTYNDIKAVAGETVAEIVYAVTNDKGRSRKDRAGEKYYDDIRNTSWAKFVKMCDRMANIEYSASTGSKMLEVYRKEHDAFIESLFPNRNRLGIYPEMIKESEALLSSSKPPTP